MLRCLLVFVWSTYHCSCLHYTSVTEVEFQFHKQFLPSSITCKYSHTHTMFPRLTCTTSVEPATNTDQGVETSATADPMLVNSWDDIPEPVPVSPATMLDLPLSGCLSTSYAAEKSQMLSVMLSTLTLLLLDKHCI